MASLTKKTGLLIFLNLFKYAVGFLVPMILVRLLTKDDYGTYQQLLLVGSMAVGIMTMGFPASIYYFYKQVDGEDRRRAFVLQNLLIFTASGVLTSFAIFLLRDFIAVQFNNVALGEYLAYYCLYILFFLSSEYFIHLLISKDLYSLGVKIEGAEVVYRVALLVLPLLMGFGMYGLVWSLAIYAITRFLFYLFIIRNDVFPIVQGWRENFFFREQLAYSLPLAISSLLGLVSRTIDRLLISANYTVSQLATYSVGALEIPLDVIFHASVANVLRATLPSLAKQGNLTEIIRIWRAAVRKLAIIILPFFVFLMMFSYEFITFLFTDEYADSVDVFRIYLFLIPLHIFILNVILQVFGKTNLTLKVVAASVSFNVIMSFILIKTIGYYGPAIATVATNYVASALYFVLILKVLRCSLVELVPLGVLARVLTSATVAVAVVKLVFLNVENRFVILSVGGLAFFIIYGMTLLVMREVSLAEAKSILNALRAKIDNGGRG